tara:strand:- start:1191 stop:1994 length:804 start_codon:yes stop_codon:yes gene_type:complete
LFDLKKKVEESVRSMPEIKHHKIFVATPAFGHQAYINYVNGLLATVVAQPPKDLSYSFQFHIHAGGALISYARNECVRNFLKSDCTKMLFIDADIGFGPEDFWRLLRKDVEFSMSPYITKALNDVKDSRFILSFGDQNLKVDEDGFVKVTSGPAGFMMLDRSVFDKMKVAYPECRTKMVALQDGKAVSLDNYTTFFDCLVDEDLGSLGEDISFCKRWTEMGGEIYCDTKASLTHYGIHSFQAQLEKSIEGGVAGFDAEGKKEIEITL